MREKIDGGMKEVNWEDIGEKTRVMGVGRSDLFSYLLRLLPIALAADTMSDSRPNKYINSYNGLK